jgi:hypothetical protein
MVPENEVEMVLQEPFLLEWYHREGLVSGSRVGTSRFTVRMPLPVTVHVVHSDVADWTVGRVLFFEDDRRVATGWPKKTS